MSSNEEERVAAPRERQPKMPVIRLFVAAVPILPKILTYFGRDRKSITSMEILIALPTVAQHRKAWKGQGDQHPYDNYYNSESNRSTNSCHLYANDFTYHGVPLVQPNQRGTLLGGAE